jgi:hypothetical protein
MTAPDYPPGEWSELLVGPQWVSGTTVMILTDSLANRKATVAHFSELHETLQSALNSTLAGQEGATADAIRDAFRQGADQAFQVAEKNESYAKALQRTHNSVIALRHLLTDIAEKGNKEIRDVQSSEADSATKIAKISEVIANCQREANQKAAGCADDVMDAGQNVVDAQGTGQSFRGLAHADAIDNVNQQPNLNTIENQVRGKLDQPASQPLTHNNALAPPPEAPSGSGPVTDGGASRGVPTPTAPVAPPAGSAPNAPGSPPSAPAAFGGARSGAATPAVPASAAASGGSAPRLSAPGFPDSPQVPTSSPMSAGGSAPMAGTPMGSPPAGAGGAPTHPTSGASPSAGGGGSAGSASSSASAGAASAAPAAAGAAGLASGPVQAVESQAQQAQQTPPASTTASTFPSAGAGAAAAAEHGHAFSAPSPATYSSHPSSSMVTGPAASPVATPAATAGPLPAYGADLRPPIVPPPVTPASQPPPPIVSSAPPILPPAGAAGLGQPASQAPPGMGIQGVMATANGALTGAMSTEATARARLQRLVSAVARQQPRLAWAVGDRLDDTTMLVTDLASGWIPSGIAIPAAVTLLQPASRRGDLEALLGEVKMTAVYVPGHYQPEPEDDEPVPTSLWPRRAPDIEELGWQLSDATHWRDGLPRLAHTVAKAASRGTGVLDSEAEQLREELIDLADCVLDNYPDDVDAVDVGNWQLLAAIDALVAQDKIAANYHLAWFLTCNTAAVEGITR